MIGNCYIVIMHSPWPAIVQHAASYSYDVESVACNSAVRGQLYLLCRVRCLQ